MNNFHYAISLANTLYGVEGNMDDLEEIGMIAHNFIGNKNTRLYRALLDCINGLILLPCNVDVLEAVTYVGPEDGNRTSNIHLNGDRQAQYTEDYIESLKFHTDPLYISGEFVNYRQTGNTLQINKGFGKVNILYHGMELDDEGLPCINEKEAIAIATYIAYTLKYKEALRTHNGSVMEEAKDLKKSWLNYCDAARVPEHISQNDMNKILDAKSSWGRKVYNRSYKPTL